MNGHFVFSVSKRGVTLFNVFQDETLAGRFASMVQGECPNRRVFVVSM